MAQPAVGDFRAMEQNLRSTLGIFAGARPEGDTGEFIGVAAASSGVSFSMFNAAILTAPVRTAAELDRRVAAASEYYAPRNLPWSFWVCQGWLEPAVRQEVGETFLRRGLHLIVELPGMQAQRVLPPTRALPALDFVRVKDRHSREDFTHIMSATFGIPFTTCSQVYESESMWREGFAGWLAYENGLPVASAATLASAGVIGVYAVGTLPMHQRKGFGEAVMRHAIEHARAQSGIERTVLQSSEAGFALYQRMGYRTITRYAVFAYS